MVKLIIPEQQNKFWKHSVGKQPESKGIVSWLKNWVRHKIFVSWWKKSNFILTYPTFSYLHSVSNAHTHISFAIFRNRGGRECFPNFFTAQHRPMLMLENRHSISTHITWKKVHPVPKSAHVISIVFTWFSKTVTVLWVNCHPHKRSPTYGYLQVSRSLFNDALISRNRWVLNGRNVWCKDSNLVECNLQLYFW